MINKLSFDEDQWLTVAPGCREIRHVIGSHILRLVEFTDAFAEPDWCELGHQGYVLTGEFHIDFEGTKVPFHEGEGLYIPAGQKHKLSVNANKWTRILLFESSA